MLFAMSSLTVDTIRNPNTNFKYVVFYAKFNYQYNKKTTTQISNILLAMPSLTIDTTER